jgi:signal transduction histidine kinase
MRNGGHLAIRLSKEERSWRMGGAFARLTIADNGSGIPRDLINRIFEPFITTKGETGTGLGLWVTAEIARKNDWNIRVHSCTQPDRSGTTFSILIPLMRQAAQPNSVRPSQSVPSAGNGVPLPRRAAQAAVLH